MFLTCRNQKASAGSSCKIIELLWEKAVNGGIVMVNFVSDYVYTDSPERASIADVVKHINRIRKVAGVDHVGIGADYNGVNEY